MVITRKLFALILTVALFASLVTFVPAAAQPVQSSASHSATADGNPEQPVRVGREATWNDYHYFLEDGELFSSYRGGAPQHMAGRDIGWMVVRGGLLYYAQAQGFNTDIYRRDLATGVMEVLCRVYYPIEAFDVADDFLYYLHQGEVVRQSVVDGSEDTAGFLTAPGGFYVDEGGNIQGLELEPEGELECPGCVHDHDHVHHHFVLPPVADGDDVALVPLSIASTGIAGIDKLLAVAQKEIGYKVPTYVTVGQHRYPVSKYGTWAGYGHAHYCGLFVEWCAAQAGISADVIPRGVSLYAKGLLDWYRHSSRRLFVDKRDNPSYQPKPGDLIFYTWDGKDQVTGQQTTGDVLWATRGTVSHVGIVTGSTSTHVSTIEGNTRNPAGEWSYVYNKRPLLNSRNIIGYATPKYCGHAAWDALGKCTACGHEFDYSAVDRSAQGTYVTKLSSTDREWYSSRSPWYRKPYAAATLVEHSTATRTVEGKVTNSFGMIFYKTTQGLYMEASLFETIYERASADIPSDISFRDLTYPTGTHLFGQGFNLHGTISSSHNLTRIVGEVIDANTTNVVLSASAAPHARSYAISSGRINVDLKFAALQEGSYYVRYTVTDASGGAARVWKSPTFQVLKATGQMSAFPTISVSNITDGKRITISSADPHATLYYSINGGPEETASAAVTLSYTTSGTYSVSAYTTRPGYTKGAYNNQTVNVAQLPSPTISAASFGDNHAMVTIVGSGIIYYTTDGSTPGVLSEKYTTPLKLTHSCSIKAISVEHGSATSSVAERRIDISAPGQTAVALYNTGPKVAQGAAATVEWQRVEAATEYTAYLHYGGEVVSSFTASGTHASFPLPEAGDYRISVRAGNFVGYGNESNFVSITSIAPLTVTIVDRVDVEANVRDEVDEHGNPVSTQVQGNVIGVQRVPYGSLPGRLAVPLKKGYNFAGWSPEMYYPVYEDTFIYAEYEIKHFTVTFRDSNGDVQLSSEEVMYSGRAPVPANYNTPIAYMLAGWSVDNSKSEGYDYTYVEGDMVLRSVYHWENEALPSHVRINRVERKDDLKTYSVDIGIKNNPVDSTTARLIVTFETASGQTVYTHAEDINLEPGGMHDFVDRRVDLIYRDRISRVNVVLVGYDSIHKRTAGMISEMATTTDIEAQAIGWSAWSDWSTDQVAGDDTESKVQYRSRDKAVTTSNQTKSIAGWTYDHTTSSVGVWQETATVVQAEDNDHRKREVTSYWVAPVVKTQYRYGRWTNGSRLHFCPSLGRHHWGGTWYLQFSDWSDTATNIDTSFTGFCGGAGHDHRHPNHFIGNTAYWHRYTEGGKTYYWQETREVQVAAGYTMYRYRDTYYTHHFYNWSEWSDWGDTPLASSSTRNVETRTVHRYRNKVYGADPGTGDEEVSTGSYEVSGKLSDAYGNDFAGKKATVLVYKKTNTDPTNEQLQFMQQITIGPDGAYLFTVKPKEMLDYYDTGDFIVALAMEGCNNLINVEVIRAPVPTHTVKFLVDEVVVATQVVPRHGAADVYAVVPPEREGETFLRWSASPTNVVKDVSVTARYERNTYVVVYVDHENRQVQFEILGYGDAIATPDVTPIEGKTFLGWDTLGQPGGSLVTGHIVVQALWEDVSYTVTFVDFEGSVVSEQIVPHGKSAVMPAFVDYEGQLRPWSLSDEHWWNVKQDMTVYPYLHRERTAVAPTSSLPPGDYRGAFEVGLHRNSEEAKIYYCLDYELREEDAKNFVAGIIAEDDVEMQALHALGSLTLGDEADYSLEILEYTGPITIAAGTSLFAFTVDSAGGISEIAAFAYGYDFAGDDKGVIPNTYEVDAASPQIVVSDVQTSGGRLISVPIHLANNPGIAGLRLSVSFNSQNLTLISSTNGIVFGDSEFLSETGASGTCKLFWTASANNLDDGLLATLLFRAHDSTATEEYEMGLTIEAAFDADQAAVSLAAVSGKLGVAPGTSKPPLVFTTSYKVGATASATSLAPNELLVANVTATNSLLSARQVLLVVAMYNANGTMEAVSYASRNIPAGQTENLNAGFRLPANVSGYAVKAFIWDGTDLETTNMIPLSGVVIITE